MPRKTNTQIADEIRALRGNLSQKEFGMIIGKPQSVISRLENAGYGKVNLQTLLDIAEKCRKNLVIKFVK
jgi:transcriptional regulator with XRE-family HTH domain